MARRKKRTHEGHDGGQERWLVSYADMVTLLMALFVVMFAMANVNTSKFEELKNSLKGAISNSLLPGGDSVADTGGPAAVSPTIDPTQTAGDTGTGDVGHDGTAETKDLAALKKRVDDYAAANGLSDKLQARVERRGLVITVLTDELLFDSGSAVLRAEGHELMRAIGALLRQESEHQVVVEGYTDSNPIHTAQFPSNWELSTARASTVVRSFIRARVAPQRLTATGRAHLDPLASNATAAGRSRNRRVQIVLPRHAETSGSAPAIGFEEPQIGP